MGTLCGDFSGENVPRPGGDGGKRGLKEAMEWHQEQGQERHLKLLRDGPRPPMQKDVLWRWHSQECEDIVVVVHADNPVQDPLHFHDYFIMACAYEGDFQERIGEKVYTIAEGNVCLLRPEVYHQIVARGEDDPARVIVCALIHPRLLYHSFLPLISEAPVFLDFFLNYINGTDGPPMLQFQTGRSGEIRMLVETMLVEYAEKSSSYCRVLECTFATLLALLARVSAAPQKKIRRSQGAPIREVIEFLSEHYATATLESTAQLFSYHPNYLSAALRKETGQSFSELLRDFKLNQAATLLERSALNIGEVANLVGYPHLGNFYKVFRSKYGMTPRQYMDAHRER